MDPVTHGLIGATASQSIASSEKLRPAAITGAVAAMIADLDILIHNPSDPLLNVEFHRQFTHSLVFIPFGAIIATAVVWWFVRKKLSLREVYAFSFIAYATSGVIDALTSYGTKLLWPFVDERYAWNIISVFDPLFTAGVLVAVVMCVYRQDKVWLLAAWGWAFMYLLWGSFQYGRADNIAQQIAFQKGHYIERQVIKPTIGNQLLWNIRYETNNRLHAYGVRLSPFSGPVIYEGEATPLIDWRSEYSEFKGTTLYDDIRRFAVLSDDYLVRHPAEKNIIGDGRYAMLPTSVKPLWGIRVDTAKPDQHVSFLQFRDAGTEVREAFFKMLLGE